jgi:hypothetical protein
MQQDQNDYNTHYFRNDSPDLNPLKPSGYSVYQHVQTQKLYVLPTQGMRVLISEQIAIISLHITDRFL